jgi:hypothetical protein
LDSEGYIRRESPSEFVQVRGNKMDKIWAMGGGATFYSDRGQETKLRAEMAWLMNEQRKYSILEGKHCHAFTAECVTGENLNETPILPFTGLELHIKDYLIQEDDFEWYNWPSEYWTRWDW